MERHLFELDINELIDLFINKNQLRSGEDINDIKDYDGNTILHILLYKYKQLNNPEKVIDIFYNLLNKGADPDIANKQGITPNMILKEYVDFPFEDSNFIDKLDIDRICVFGDLYYHLNPYPIINKDKDKDKNKSIITLLSRLPTELIPEITIDPDQLEKICNVDFYINELFCNNQDLWSRSAENRWRILFKKLIGFDPDHMSNLSYKDQYKIAYKNQYEPIINLIKIFLQIDNNMVVPAIKILKLYYPIKDVIDNENNGNNKTNKDYANEKAFLSSLYEDVLYMVARIGNDENNRIDEISVLIEDLKLLHDITDINDLPVGMPLLNSAKPVIVNDKLITSINFYCKVYNYTYDLDSVKPKSIGDYIENINVAAALGDYESFSDYYFTFRLYDYDEYIDENFDILENAIIGNNIEIVNDIIKGLFDTTPDDIIGILQIINNTAERDRRSNKNDVYGNNKENISMTSEFTKEIIKYMTDLIIKNDIIKNINNDLTGDLYYDLTLELNKIIVMMVKYNIELELKELLTYLDGYFATNVAIHSPAISDYKIDGLVKAIETDNKHLYKLLIRSYLYDTTKNSISYNKYYELYLVFIDLFNNELSINIIDELFKQCLYLFFRANLDDSKLKDNKKISVNSFIDSFVTLIERLLNKYKTMNYDKFKYLYQLHKLASTINTSLSASITIKNYTDKDELNDLLVKYTRDSLDFELIRYLYELGADEYQTIAYDSLQKNNINIYFAIIEFLHSIGKDYTFEELIKQFEVTLYYVYLDSVSIQTLDILLNYILQINPSFKPDMSDTKYYVDKVVDPRVTKYFTYLSNF